MSLPFTKQEYAERAERVRNRLRAADMDALLVSDPANIYWLTGAQDWCFYTPQFVVIAADAKRHPEPYWIGRAMDASGARLSCWMRPGQIRSYPESCVQTSHAHPSLYVGRLFDELELSDAAIGYESDSYYLSPRSFAQLRHALPNASFHDADLLINWLRAIKSEREISYMRQAAAIAQAAMQAAYDIIAPGVRQCDVIAAALKTQISPNTSFGGDMTGLSPIILAGEKACTAHPAWTDEPLHDNQTIALELGGCRRRYNCGLARTVHIGKAVPDLVRRTSDAVREGMDAVLSAARPGVVARDLHTAWQRVLTRHGLSKESRIGYSIGAGFCPDWGEHTISLRQEDTTELQAGMTFHVILGMWQDDWGMELSETILITPDGVECLTEFDRGIFLKH